MPDSINNYLDAIQTALRESPFVHEPKISADDRGEVWFLRGDVYFIDNSRLHFRELFIQQGEPLKRAMCTITKRPMGHWFSVMTTHHIIPIYPRFRTISTLGMPR
jgi:hypothetical protein